jgi:hypothetical protein
MRRNANDLDVTVENDDYYLKEADWGGMRVTKASNNIDYDTTPLLKGLPNDMCQTPHWGYLSKGRVRVRYEDRTEVIEAGDLYYIEPNHIEVFEAGTEFIAFSPTEEQRRTNEHMMKTMRAMME